MIQRELIVLPLNDNDDVSRGNGGSHWCVSRCITRSSRTNDCCVGGLVCVDASGQDAACVLQECSVFLVL